MVCRVVVLQIEVAAKRIIQARSQNLALNRTTVISKNTLRSSGVYEAARQANSQDINIEIDEWKTRVEVVPACAAVGAFERAWIAGLIMRPAVDRGWIGRTNRDRAG